MLDADIQKPLAHREATLQAQFPERGSEAPRLQREGRESSLALTSHRAGRPGGVRQDQEVPTCPTTLNSPIHGIWENGGLSPPVSLGALEARSVRCP